MPLGCRNIEPVCLGAHTVPQTTDEELKCVHLTVANNAIVGALLQLSSLVRHADDLFCDISDECQKVFERTDKLTKKIRHIGDHVGKLDAKQVRVPEGDLKGFSAVTTYYEARHGYDSHLFLHTNRPQCVQDQYSLCQTNPVRVIRSADLYRKDGLSGSKMFKCWPVILNEQTVRTPDLNLPRRVNRVRSFEKKYKKLKIRERPKTIHGWDDLGLRDSKNGLTDEQNKKTSGVDENQPQVVVSIDTSGSNFERMQSMRLSDRKSQTKEEKERRKRRRRTVSGVPENIVYEIERFEKKQKVRSAPRHTPRSYSFDDLDADDNDIERDERIVKYLNDIDGKIEEREGEEKTLKLMKFFPCHRAKSLPRCVKLASVARSLSSERKSQRDLNCSCASSSISLTSSMVSGGSRLSRSTKRSSFIGNKIKSFVTKDKLRQRPKSLDLDTLFDSKPSKKSNAKERSKSSNSLLRGDTPKVPDNLLSKQFSQPSDSSIGPGTYYNFENSTLPRTQAKKYDFPWESLPKDWTTSVKLREISKRRAREDRQSSSGNWSQSGTSSNRQSVDSDIRGEGYKFQSQYSLGKDSGRDSLTLEEEYDCVTDGTSTAGYAGDETSTIAGSSDSVSVGNPKSDFTDGETQAWLQTLAVRAAKRVEVTSHDADALTSLSRLTRKNILALDLMISDDKTQRKITDEESSIYSVDQEGFYTSFHNDSGLKKSTNTLVDEDVSTPVKDSHSICSADSVIFKPSADNFAGLRKGSSASKVLSKVTPPTPPTRLSSNKSNNQSANNANSSNTSDKNLSNASDGDTCSPPQLHSFPSVESSISESDQEAVFRRVKDKTKITSTAFPTLVALSTSEDDSSPDTSAEKLRTSTLTKGGVFTFDDTAECGIDDLSALLNTDDTSQFSFISNGSVVKQKSGSNSSSECEFRHSKSAFECTDQGYDSLNLPKRSRNTSRPVKQTEASYRSWPRSHKSRTPGILKTPEKPNGPSKAPKTLNFAPVINLFKPGMPNSVQMPLPSPTNSSSSEGNISSMLNTSSFKSAVSPESSYKLAYPLEASNTQSKMNAMANPQSDLPMKYQPVITVTPRSRSGERQTSDRSGGYVKLTPDSTKTPIYAPSNTRPTAQSTPNTMATTNKMSPSLYAVSPVMAAKDPSNQNGRSDSGYMDMDKTIALTSMGSFSSLVSSDVNFSDNSTYVSMSSPCSSPNLSNMDFPMSLTPSGSVDSLSDQRRTPTNGMENDTYQINTSIQGNVYNAASTNVKAVPVTDGYTASRTIQNGGGQKSLNSFSAISDVSTNSGVNNSYSSIGSTTTPSRRSFNETSDSDLTKVTQLSQLSTPGSSMKSVRSTSDQTPRQHPSRADTRHEPSYRSNVQANRRSLPSDASHSIYGNNPKLVGLKDNVLPNKMSSPKGMSSSRSYPSSIGSAGNAQYKPNTAAPHIQGRNSNHPKHVSSPVTPTADPASSPRSDSYRVALGVVNKRNGSPKTSLTQSKSTPVFPLSRQSGPYRVAMDMNPKITVDDDVMCRADSYRIAVRNTNGLVPDVANRNSSYRVAVNDPLSAINAKMESLTFVNQKSPSSGRDTKPMGYNDREKVKGVSSRTPLKDSKTSPQPQSQSSGRIRKVTKTDVDPIQILSSMDYNRNDTRKSDKNNQNRSSTYIQFDSIFEDAEDFTNSTESLRMASLKSPMLDTVSQGSMNKSPMLDNLSQSSSLHKASGVKSKHSLMNGNARDNDSNIRTIKSSKSGKPIEIEDNWRYSQV